jgi:hypothetical protein
MGHRGRISAGNRLRLAVRARGPTWLSAERKVLLGAHLAHISTGNGGNGGVGSGIQKGLFCRYLLPFHALRNPLVPTLNRLDKAEVTGSSPVSPIAKRPVFTGRFAVSRAPW